MRLGKATVRPVLDDVLGTANTVNGNGTYSPMVASSLDLRFADDQAFTVDPVNPGGCLITSRSGPDAKFSRLSGATQVNADGVVEYAPENTHVYSETLAGFVDNGVAKTLGAYESPIAGESLVAVTASMGGGFHRIIRSFIPVTTGTSYTASCFIKHVNHRWAQHVIWDGITVWVASFDLENGLTGAVTAGATSLIEATELPGVYRISITFTPAGSPLEHDVQMALVDTDVQTAFDAVGDEVIGVGGMQLERHTSARTYLPTTSAPVYGPRFDYDPVTLECKGLLIEEQRTNLCLQSSSFDTVPWFVNGAAVVVTPNDTLAPDGTITGSKVEAFAEHYLLQNIATAVTPLATYTFSFFAKKGTNLTPLLAVFNNTVFSEIGSFDYGSLLLEDEWVRVVYTFVVPLGCTQISVRPTTGYALGSVYLWGSQVEQGTSPSSYIPTTTTAPVVRSADVCDITGSDFAGFYNQSEGTIVSHHSIPTGAANKIIVSFDNGTYNDRHQIGNSSADARTYCAVGGVAQFDQIVGIVAPSDAAIALAYKLNDYAVSFEGQAAITDNVGTVPTVNRLHIGSDAIDDSIVNGNIARLTYYPRRLSNAKIQSLTA